MAEKAKKATAQVIDFTNVKERGNFNPKHVEPGDYVAKITKVETTESKSDGEAMWVFTMVPDEHPRASYPYYVKLVENQIWKLKNLFEAIGTSVGARKIKVDPNKLVGKTIGIALEDDEYEGRLKSTVIEVFPESDVTGAPDDDTDPEDDDVEDDADLEEDDIEEEPAPKKKAAKKAPAKKAAKKKPAPEPEEGEDEDEEEDDDELELDEL